MAVSKKETTGLLLLVGLFLIGGKKALAALSPRALPLLTPPLPPGMRVEVDLGDGVWRAGTVDTGGMSATMDDTGDSKDLSPPRRVRALQPGGAADDGAKLVARANQHAALAWAPLFAHVHTTIKGHDVGVSNALALAMARWAGIESSGVPITSRLDERGLMQVGPQLGGPDTKPPPPAFDQAGWVALVDPDTSHEQHADMAVHYVDWLYGRAATHISDPPSDPVDQLWYAKLYHQRPVDVRDGKLHGPALPMARELAQRWANDPRAMHRLRAANVVAWGTPTP